MKCLLLVLLGVMVWPSHQKILKECRDKKVDILFILDVSGSVSEDRFEIVKKFVISIVKRSFVAPDQVQIGLMTFAYKKTIHWKLNTYKSTGEVIKAVRALNKTGSQDSGTNTHLALNTGKDLLFGRSHGGRHDALKMLILVTDGPSKYEEKTRASAEALHKARATVTAIGIGKYNRKEINAIASDPDDKYAFMADKFEDLPSLAKKVAAVSCAGYNAYIKCKDGFINRCCPIDQVSFEGSCYFFGSLLLNDFRTANKACKAMGAELVTIDSYQEDEFLVQTLDRMQKVEKVNVPYGYYTGWHRNAGKWEWISGEDTDYTPNRWYGSYPYANTAHYGECMVMHRSYSPWKWMQTRCGKKFGFICES